MNLIDFRASAQDAFPDLDSAVAVEILKRMTQHSALSFAGELTYPAYKYIPTSYILCERDKTIPPSMQEKFIEKIKTESGKEVNVHKSDTGHCPNITEAEKLAHVIVEISSLA